MSSKTSSKTTGLSDVEESASRRVRDAHALSSSERLSVAHQFRDGEQRLEIDPLVIARDVKHRRAIGAAVSFPNTVESLWGLASVRAHGRPVELSLRWWREHELVSVNPFVVSEGIKWSEWSQVTISPKSVGSWRVELFYPERALTLLTAEFKVTEARPIHHEAQGSTTRALPSRPQESEERVGARSVDSQVSKSEMSASLSAQDPTHKTRPPTTPHDVLRIKRLEVARAVKRRRPLGIGTRFTLDDERLWGYIEVTNPERPQHVWMEWSRDDQLRSRLKVRVGVSRTWRTWSWQRLSRYDTGRWRLKVTSPSGELLAQTHFIVSATR